MLKTFFLLLTSAIILNSYSIPCVYDDCFGVYNGSFIVKKDGKIVCVDENAAREFIDVLRNRIESNNMLKITNTSEINPIITVEIELVYFSNNNPETKQIIVAPKFSKI